MKPLKAKTAKRIFITSSPPWREEGGLVLWRGQEERLGDFSLKEILNLIFLLTFFKPARGPEGPAH